MREGQKTLAEQQQKESRERELEDQHHHKRSSSRDSFSKDDRDSPILNLSNKSTHENNSDISAEDDVYVSDNDDDLASNDESASNPLLPKPKSMVEPHDTNRDGSEKTEDKVNNNNGNGLPSGPQVRKIQPILFVFTQKIETFFMFRVYLVLVCWLDFPAFWLTLMLPEAAKAN